MMDISRGIGCIGEGGIWDDGYIKGGGGAELDVSGGGRRWGDGCIEGGGKRRGDGRVKGGGEGWVMDVSRLHIRAREINIGHPHIPLST